MQVGRAAIVRRKHVGVTSALPVWPNLLGVSAWVETFVVFVCLDNCPTHFICTSAENKQNLKSCLSRSKLAHSIICAPNLKERHLVSSIVYIVWG